MTKEVPGINPDANPIQRTEQTIAKIDALLTSPTLSDRLRALYSARRQSLSSFLDQDLANQAIPTQERSEPQPLEEQSHVQSQPQALVPQPKPIQSIIFSETPRGISEFPEIVEGTIFREDKLPIDDPRIVININLIVGNTQTNINAMSATRDVATYPVRRAEEWSPTLLPPGQSDQQKIAVWKSGNSIQVKSGPVQLSLSELQVAYLSAKGLNNDEIAERLIVTKNTVKYHLRNLQRRVPTEREDRFWATSKEVLVQLARLGLLEASLFETIKARFQLPKGLLRI